MEFLQNESEKEIYLSSLLESEQILKEQLAFEIHSKKTEILYLEVLVSKIGNLVDGNSNLSEKIEALKLAVANLQNDFTALYEKYLLNPANKLSVNFSLQICIKKLAVQFDAKIDFETKIINEIGIDQNWKQPYYLACGYAIEIVCHFGYRLINIELVILQNGFQLNVEGKEVEEIAVDTATLDDRLNKLKGILVWKKGIVNSVTDWKSMIRIGFPQINL